MPHIEQPFVAGCEMMFDQLIGECSYRVSGAFQCRVEIAGFEKDISEWFAYECTILRTSLVHQERKVFIHHLSFERNVPDRINRPEYRVLFFQRVVIPL